MRAVRLLPGDVPGGLPEGGLGCVRIMGLDVGSKTVGVALSDPSGRLGQPLCVIRRVSTRKDMDRLVSLIDENGVARVVVGLPRNMDGSLGASACLALRFAEALGARASVPVVTWDERLTTVAAERALIEADVSRRRRRAVIDSVAASMILQSYLDRLRALESKGGSEGNIAPGN